jgi:atypical dual specificity phosphatase
MLERCSWILPGELAVGSFPKTPDSALTLQALGITAVLCLTETHELPVPPEIAQQFQWARVAIPDGYTGGIPERQHFQQALAILKQWRAADEVVYVHCFAGIGRSASVCTAYLVQTQGIALATALEWVKQCHPCSEPDAHQVRVMGEYFASLAGSS